MSSQTLIAPPVASCAAATLASPATTKYDVSARRVELWSPWSRAGRPGTAADEARLVVHLRTLAGAEQATTGACSAKAPSYARQHVTALVTALRSALTGEQMLQSAPGLQPRALLAAYDDLECRRAISAAAWQAIVDVPTVESLATHGPTAARLLPVVIVHLEALRLRRKTDAPVLRATIAGIEEEIARTLHSTLLLEESLDGGRLSDAHESQVGEMLYDAFGEGAWSLSTFLAPRVGTLVPARVAAVLGEDRGERTRIAS